MPSATCHCAAVRIELPHRPECLTECNCSICRRYGVLWAYYPAAEVSIVAAPDAIDEYVWGDRSLKFVRCRTCGCVTHWLRLDPVKDGRMGVNARNFDPAELGEIRIRLLDGASSWEYLD